MSSNQTSKKCEHGILIKPWDAMNYCKKCYPSSSQTSTKKIPEQNADPKLPKKWGWLRHFRSDKGIWEDVCHHGIGHENDVHGCDGCCAGLYEEDTRREKKNAKKQK